MTKPLVSVTIGLVSVASLIGFSVAAQAPPPPPPPPPPPVFSLPGFRAETIPEVPRTIPLGSAEIRGVLIDAASGRPIAGGVVMLSKSDMTASNDQFPRVTRAVISPGSDFMRVEAQAAPSVFARPAVTDAQGRFTFHALPAGTYFLAASRATFLDANYGQTRLGGTGRPIQVLDAQQQSLTFPMLRPGAVEGIVTDESGAPLMSAQVQATRYGVIQGVRRATLSASASTDDRGRYRIFGLFPGDYTVSVTPQAFQTMAVERAATEQAAYERAITAALDGRSPLQASGLSIELPRPDAETFRAFAPTYYPSSATAATASRVSIDAGTERSGVDITFRPVRTARLRGQVAGSPGPHVGIQIALTSDEPFSGINGTMVNRANPDGSFTLGSVVPGRYVLTAMTVPGPVSARGAAPAGMAEADRLWARTVITVEDGQPDVMLTLQPGRIIAGSVVRAGGRGAASAAGLQVTITNAAGTAAAVGGPLPVATTDADGRFELRGVPAGRFTVRTQAGAVKSVMIDGEDTLDFPLDVDGSRDFGNAVVTLTERLAQVSGSITAPDGTAVDLTAVLIAADRRYWTPGSRRILTSRADTSGRYAFANLPAGDYLLAAVTDFDPEQLLNHEFLGALAQGGVRVAVAEGGTHVQNIRVAR